MIFGVLEFPQVFATFLAWLHVFELLAILHLVSSQKVQARFVVMDRGPGEEVGELLVHDCLLLSDGARGGDDVPCSPERLVYR